MNCAAQDAGGATAIEYALVASLISVFILTAVTNIGTTLLDFFQSVVSNIS